LSDESYIQLAIEIAKKGIGKVSPNPLVGCLIIKNNRIIGAGYHEKYGGNHAEINALENCKESSEGAALYINLEPCSHQGKTPPCVDKIIEKKIKKVIIGTLDMNPLVSGTGIKKLKAAGIEVKVGVLEKECIELNKFFFKYITKKIPYVTLKTAQTIDGRIADKNGNSRWISSINSRKLVHNLRSKYDAVLVGSGTIKKDNPSLTVRLTEGRNPKRVIIDTNLELKSSLKILSNNSDRNLIILTSRKSADKKRKVRNLMARGINVVFVKVNDDGKLSLKNALRLLGGLQISSLLVEGGSSIFTSFIKDNLFDDILMFVSPKILGCGVPVIENIGRKNIKNALKVKVNNLERVGEDLLIELSR
jgi:diaminohydroxyphosphoribosylaminopyrimidine deaminase/5-amino-6-(5-phosphoribosylamino)uracil reductase